MGFDEQIGSLVYQDVQVNEYTKKLKHGMPWDVVVVDDISDEFAPLSQQQRRLKGLFMQWYENGTKLVITSNVNTKALATAISPAVDSRLTQTVNSVHFPDVDFRNFRKDIDENAQCHAVPV